MDVDERFGLLADDAAVERAAAALREHGFVVEIVTDGAAAKARALALVPAGAQVMTMSSQTLIETGIREAVEKGGRYDDARTTLNDPDAPIERKKLLGYAAAWALGSVHAVTEDGSVMIGSNTGSQLGAYAYGAEKVLWVVGTQKVVKDEATGMRRLETYCLPLENERALKAYGRPSGLSEILVMRRQNDPSRITMLLVKEKLGF